MTTTTIPREARSANKRIRCHSCWRCGLPLFVLFIMGAEPPHVATTPHLAPEQARATFKVPDGFEVQLVAAEPEINKPINMAFDAKGRLWVTSTVEYPYPAKDRPGKDSVKILSDFGPDGRARKVDTFADELNIPIGILPYKDGAIVYSIPNIWFLRDTDGDGKCDKREVLYSGFGHKDTHGMVNGFFMGFDGWVYACHGYLNDSTVKGTDGHEIKMNSGNVFRFKPDGSRVELFAQGQVNPFGSCMDKWGNLYTACCHSKPITLVMRGAVYESFTKPHDGLGFAPAMVHNYKGSTALCGLAWYEADYFPKEYQESFYLGDVVNNCVNRFTVTWKGATPTAHQQPDFLTSTDPWFRPCDIKLGPDGALYIADFYNRIIGHYEVPLNHPGRDRTSGRIWRVVRKDKPVDKVPDRTKASVEEIFNDMDSRNIAVRLMATQTFVDRKMAIDIPKHKFPTVLTRSAEGQCHLLWALYRTGCLSEGLETSLRYHDNETLTVHSLRLIGDRGAPVLRGDEVFLATILDKKAHTRRVASEVFGHANVKSNIKVLFLARGLKTALEDKVHDVSLIHTQRIALRNALMNSEFKLDELQAYIQEIAQVAVGVPTANGCELLLHYVKKKKLGLNKDQIKHCFRYAEWKEMPIEEFIEWTNIWLGNDLTICCEVISESAKAMTSEKIEALYPFRTWAIETAEKALKSPDPAGVERGLKVAAAINDSKLNQVIQSMASDRQRNDHVRGVVMPAVVSSRTGLVAQTLSDATESLALREAAAKALAGVNKPEARDALVAALPTAPSKLAATIAQGLAGSKPSAEQICLAVEKGQASPRLLADRTIRQKLETHGLKDRVAKLTEGLPPLDKQVEELIAKKRELFQKSKPDLTAGKELFTKHCAICHQVGGQGAKIGPQLDGIGVRGLDRLLEDTLDPSRNVDPAFRNTNLQLGDGRSLSGLFLREDGATLIFADSQGKEFTVKKDQIEQRNVSPLSAMPTNVLESLKDDELTNVMAYLLSLKK